MKLEGTPAELAALIGRDVKPENLGSAADIAAAAIDAELDKPMGERKRQHYKQARALVVMALRGAE